MQCMQTEWNKAIRKTLQLPYRTHRNILPLLVRMKTFSEQHRARVSKFVNAFQNSDNKQVRFLGLRARFYTFGALGRNYVRLQKKLPEQVLPTDLLAKSQMINELVDVRDNMKNINVLQRKDVVSMIDYLCTM